MMGLVATPASAHNWDRCGDGHATRWPTTSTSRYYSSSWPSSYTAGIRNAESSFNQSDFDYYSASVTSALVTWRDYNSSDTGIAGATYISADCSRHTIGAATLYYNFPHFSDYPHSVNAYTCTAIHEMTHGVGFDHNLLTNSSGAPVSVLYQYHGTRCHNSVVYTMQSHDFYDVNGRY